MDLMWYILNNMPFISNLIPCISLEIFRERFENVNDSSQGIKTMIFKIKTWYSHIGTAVGAEIKKKNPPQNHLWS